MKNWIGKVIVGSNLGSLVRTGVGLAGAWLVGQGATEIVGEGNAGIDTFGELLGGSIMVLAYFGLKLIDGTKFGWLGKLVGPRVENLGHSGGRTLLTTLNGLIAGIGMPQLEGDPAQWVTLALLFLVDRIWAAKKP